MRPRLCGGLLAVALVLVACSGSPPEVGSENGGVVTTGGTVEEGQDEPFDATIGDGVEVVTGLVGVEVEVSNALAPFDHHSNVDNLLLELGLSRERVRLTSECRVAEGFPPIQLSPLPDRDDPILMANAAFPYVEALARDGFPNLPGTPGSPDDSREPSEAEREVGRRCAAEVDGAEGGVATAYELYVSVRGPWEQVLGEIEATEEVRALVAGFGGCLRAEGVPPEYASSEVAYLSYVDELLFRSGTDESGWPEIRERMGKLYVQCGRELFEARERLRGGERRTAFLREHEVAIRELSNLLYGVGASP